MAECYRIKAISLNLHSTAYLTYLCSNIFWNVHMVFQCWVVRLYLNIWLSVKFLFVIIMSFCCFLFSIHFTMLFRYQFLSISQCFPLQVSSCIKQCYFISFLTFCLKQFLWSRFLYARLEISPGPGIMWQHNLSPLVARCIMIHDYFWQQILWY